MNTMKNERFYSPSGILFLPDGRYTPYAAAPLQKRFPRPSACIPHENHPYNKKGESDIRRTEPLCRVKHRPAPYGMNGHAAAPAYPEVQK